MATNITFTAVSNGLVANQASFIEKQGIDDLKELLMTR